MRLLITCMIILAMAGASQAGTYRPIKAKHFCVQNSTGTILDVQFVVSPDYGSTKMRFLWAVRCEGTVCNGTRIWLDHVDKGEPFGVTDIMPIREASMWRSPTGSIIISWGLHQIFVRLDKKDATYIEKAGGSDGKDVMTTATCPTRW